MDAAPGQSQQITQMKSLKQMVRRLSASVRAGDGPRHGLGATPHMIENVKQNLLAWDKEHAWSKDGDEWDGQAAVCGVPYPTWKESLVQHLLVPHITKQTHVLEIAPGHGRWTEYLVRLAGHVTVIDLSASCLDFCRNRFQTHSNIDYVLTPGDRLPLYAEGRIDFVWSYDSFVHMDRQVIQAYLAEIRRVLKVNGSAIIHHSNVEDLANHRQDNAAGWRSAMSAELIRELAQHAGLSVSSQYIYWDDEKKIGVPRFGDRLTQLKREIEAG
jgi:ubiquinone/menaquinone biosynthesis C-methylase UbiE